MLLGLCVCVFRCLVGGRLELDDVKRLVAGRSSVPKEQVYPKFHAMATHWLQLQVCGLGCWLAGLDGFGCVANLVVFCQEIRDKVLSRKAVHGAITPFVPPSVCTLHLETVRKVRAYRVPHSGKGGSDGKGEDDTASVATDTTSKTDASEEPPVRLSLEASPDFMQLPLEFQVRCFVAVVVHHACSTCLPCFWYDGRVIVRTRL